MVLISKSSKNRVITARRQIKPQMIDLFMSRRCLGNPRQCFRLITMLHNCRMASRQWHLCTKLPELMTRRMRDYPDEDGKTRLTPPLECYHFFNTNQNNPKIYPEIPGSGIRCRIHTSAVLNTGNSVTLCLCWGHGDFGYKMIRPRVPLNNRLNGYCNLPPGGDKCASADKILLLYRTLLLFSFIRLFCCK